MAGDLRVRRREPQPAEEATGTPLANMPLGAGVRLGTRHTDSVQAKLEPEPLQLGCGHDVIVAAPPEGARRALAYDRIVKAIRIHEEGGPEVLRYEEVPDPVPGPDEALVELRAASMNHLDVWLRRGLPSVAKPRILGADGSGVIAGTDERVVINPGLSHDEGIYVLGEHRDGTHAELIAVPRSSIYPIPAGLSFERPPPSPWSSRPPTGCSPRKRGCSRANGSSSGASAAESRARPS
jgi:hypothetical protein